MTAVVEKSPSLGQKASVHKRAWSDILAPYLFISPFVISFLILFLGPALYALVVSFFKYAGYGSMTWVGFANYKTMLTYRFFWMQLGNTVFYAVAHMVPMMAFAFGLALIVSNRIIRLKGFFKPVMFMPQLVTAVASALIFKNFFGTEYGVFNLLLGMKLPWLTDMELARWAVVILLVWRGVGYWFIVYLAGLTSINPEIMEAAIVDGANAWQRLVKVTVPLMKNTFLFAFVVDIIGGLRIYTEPNVLVASNNAQAPADMAPMVNLLFSNMGNARFGQAAAVGWLLFLTILLASWLQFRVFKHLGEE